MKRAWLEPFSWSVIAGLNPPPDQAAALRSLAGHIVAGTATPEERAEFAGILDRIAANPPRHPTAST